MGYDVDIVFSLTDIDSRERYLRRACIDYAIFRAMFIQLKATAHVFFLTRRERASRGGRCVFTRSPTVFLVFFVIGTRGRAESMMTFHFSGAVFPKYLKKKKKKKERESEARRDVGNDRLYARGDPVERIDEKCFSLSRLYV